MELIFERENLWRALQIVSNVAASRNTLPILANVLVKASEANAGQIQLVATDLEVGIRFTVHGQVKTPGSITIPAKKLTDIVREFSSTTSTGNPTEIRLAALANDRVEIDCESAKFKIVGLSDEEFPHLPEPKDGFLTLESDILRNMIQKTVFAVSTEETRHFLNGIYFHVTPDSVRMVATDGKRLAVARHNVEGLKGSRVQGKEGEGPETLEPSGVGVILPTKAVNNVLRTFMDSSDIKIDLLENQIVFAKADASVTLISRLIEGEYPDYEAIMSPAMSNEVTLTANTEHLLAVIRRVSLLSNPKTPSIRMSFESESSTLNVSASTPDLGEAQEQVQVKVEGDGKLPLEIAFNARFVMDVLRNIESEEVLFKFRDSLSPVLVTPVAQVEAQAVNYMCVIMPMRI